MFALTAVLLAAASTASQSAGATCLPCARLHFEGTLQRVALHADGGRVPDVATGDLNHDGRVDVAAAHGSIVVLLANPDGVFRRGPELSPGLQSQAVGMADMDGDGHLDVVAGGGGIGVTRGDGSGGFLPPSPQVGASSPIVELAIADFDLDGLADVATVHGQGADLVSIYRGTGGGGLVLHTSFASGGEWPLAVVAGDFDRDGRADLAVANNRSPDPNVTVFRNAAGSFVPLTLPLDIASLDMISGDLDGDGTLDLAVAGAGGTASGIRLFHGSGTGTFRPGPAVEGPQLSHAIAAGDFDGDGDVDLAFDEAPETLHVARLGPGGQYAIGPLNVGDGLDALAVGDLSREGRSDLVLGANREVRFLRPHLGQQLAASAELALGRAEALLTDDFNGDGRADLFVYDPIVTNSSRLWLGDGALGFTPSGFLLGGRVVASADFNADGRRDIVTPTATLLGDGSGSFTQSAAFGASLVADFNVDGRSDLLAQAPTGNGSGVNLTVRLADGSGGFGAPVVTTVPTAFLVMGIAVASGRFDGDLWPDLSYVTGGGQYFLAGNGAGGFAAPMFLGSQGDGDIQSGDWNGDGYSDTVSGGQARWGGPTGLGAPAFVTILEEGGYRLKVADVNGDGRDDILGLPIGGPRSGLTVLLGEPGTGLRELGLALSGGAWDVVVADWNGDGHPDLAAGDADHGLVKLFRANDCQPVALVINPAFPALCPTPGQPFLQQPAIFATDTAGNFTCPDGPVTAALVPGSGTPAAVLGGTTTVTFFPGVGIALFTNLEVDLPGRRYRLRFTSPGLAPVVSPTFSQGLSPQIVGSAFACPGRPERYEVGFGYDSYEWRLDASALSSAQAVTLDLPLGPHALTATVEQDACSASDGLNITSVLPSLTIAAAGPTTVCAACTGALLGADVTASENAPIQWGFRSATGGPVTMLSGQTSPNYRLHGGDFPGPGVYFVVASVTCGTIAVSNDVPVTIAPTPPAREIAHGGLVRDDLQERPVSGGARWLHLAQDARASYEVVVEATSGDIGLGLGPRLEHLAGDAQTVLASAVAVGVGPSRSLRIVNAGSTRVVDFVRVTSASCGSDCGPDDTFTLRAYETTLRGSRFNNTGSQVTVLLLQNSGSERVEGEVHFWTASGAWMASQPFALEPWQLSVLQTTTVPALAGIGGTLTVSHDGRYGWLNGKAVAIEPATGLSFDTPLTTRPR